MYIELCTKLSCSDLVGVLIDCLGPPSELPQEEQQLRAKEVLLPLLVFCVEYMRTHEGVMCQHRLRKLREATIPLCLDWVAENPSEFSQSDICGG